MSDGTCDYEREEKGVLNFSNGETSKKITIRTNPRADVSVVHSIICEGEYK